MFLEFTPDTSGYMIAGYVIAFATMGIYVFSMFLRNRNLRQDLETLESFKAPVKPKTTKPRRVLKGSSKPKAMKKK